MNKLKKIILIIVILLVIILSFFIGKFTESIKYHVALAGCQKSQLPNGNYTTIKIDNSPINQMFENYYSPNLDFIEYYMPENSNVKNYIETFGYGSFHYFKTSEGDIYQCGFYK